MEVSSRDFSSGTDGILYNFGMHTQTYKVNQTWAKHSEVKVIIVTILSSVFPNFRISASPSANKLPRINKVNIKRHNHSSHLRQTSETVKAPRLLPVHTCIFPTYQAVGLFSTIEPTEFQYSESVFEGRLDDLPWNFGIVFVVISIIKQKLAAGTS